MTRNEKRSFIISILVFAVAALLPLTRSGYWVSIGVTIAMYAVLATSWALFSGPTHYISLASAAFFGIGMYVVGGFIEIIPFPVLIVLAALVGAILAASIRLHPRSSFSLFQVHLQPSPVRF